MSAMLRIIPLRVKQNQLIFASVQRTAQTSFRLFLQTSLMVANGAKFNSHNSGVHDF